MAKLLFVNKNGKVTAQFEFENVVVLNKGQDPIQIPAADYTAVHGSFIGGAAALRKRKPDPATGP